MAKYDSIGIDYNETRKPDPFLVARLHHYLNPEMDKQYLDIGCGTGNYTLKLSEKGGHFIGIDPSEEMLKIVRLRTNKIDWQIGTAERLPLNEASIDGVVASLTIHHWADLEKGFSEIFRVLKANSKLVLFTSTPLQMQGYWLNHYFPKMLKDSMTLMPKLDLIIPLPL